MAYIQIDKDINQSAIFDEVWDGFAGYIKPLTANGFYDRKFSSSTIQNSCINNVSYRSFELYKENPLTGEGDQSHYVLDLVDPILEQITYADELLNYIKDDDGTLYYNLHQLGHEDHSFRYSGNKKLGISTNPSTASMMNLVGKDQPNYAEKNLRKVYLNGVSIEILDQTNDWIKLQIKFDDVDVENDVRWCADTIVLSPVSTTSGYSLNLKYGKSITLDQGLTATRMRNPVLFDGEKIFVSKTYLKCREDSYFHMESESELILDNGSKMEVQNDATLEVEGDGVITLKEDSQIEIFEGGNLLIGDDVTIQATSGICKIIVDGDISIGNNLQFTADAGAEIRLELNNPNEVLSLYNATFTRAAIISYVDDLTLTLADFNYGGIFGFNGDYVLNSCDFDDSFASFDEASTTTNSVVVTNNCTFDDESSTYALRIDEYSEFTIEDSYFRDNQYGVIILNSGDGRFTSKIEDCTITGNTIVGVQVYNSELSILDNNIENNNYGLKILNASDVGLTGTQTYPTTQNIKNNTYNEVYASINAMPHHFHYNAVVDNDNTDPLVYYSGTFTLSITFDVSNNYWGGSTYFNASTDLYPSAMYDWSPTWDPNPGEKSGTVAESLYESALNYIELEDYSDAKESLKELIQEHNNSIYAQAAVKKLFTMESYAGNNYLNLKSYLLSEPNLQDGAQLQKLRDFYINFCEIKLENWETAINWFEGIIMDPESMEDSIFAIIDLGYTYMLMEKSGYKSVYKGAMLEHIPSSHEAYDEKREYLLSLIPGKQMSEEMQKDIQNLENGELLHNVPNPFSSSTQIWYKLDAESEVTIRVFDYTGKEARTYPVGRQPQGHHHVGFISDHLPSGVYFYNLEVNGLVTDTKKMTLIK